MNKEDLDKEKKIIRSFEFDQARLHSEFLKQKNSNYDFPDVSHWILVNKKDEDILLLQEKLMEWYNASKDKDSKRNVVLDLIQKTWRIESYCKIMDVLVQETTARYVESERTKVYLNSELNKQKLLKSKEIDLLNKKIKQLEKQIEFINK